MRVRVRRKRKGIEFFRSALTAGLCLFAIFIVIAGAYTWYIGTHGPKDSASASDEVEIPVETTKEPKVIDQTAAVGVAVQMLTSPIAPGSIATLSVRTNPQAKCTISVVYNQVASKDAGLVPKTADDYGLVSWDWAVESSAPVGKWPINVKCSNLKNSGVLTPELEISR